MIRLNTKVSVRRQRSELDPKISHGGRTRNLEPETINVKHKTAKIYGVSDIVDIF